MIRSRPSKRRNSLTDSFNPISAGAALRVLADLREAGVEPDSESYKYVLLSLARCGEDDQVINVTKSICMAGYLMPLSPTVPHTLVG